MTPSPLHPEGEDASNGAVLRLVGVAKAWGGRAVLRGIDRAFTAGSLTLVAGGNGAGKSTLLRLAAGLSRPTLGEVVRDESVVVGHVGHATFLYPDLTALENLAFWARAYGLDADGGRLMSLLERVNLAPFAHERAGKFSRGMAQRLNLARVLMQDAGILLLDEPGTGLDAASRDVLHAEMIAARNRGACVLLVSHDYAEDSPAADAVVVLADGRIAYDGPPDGYDPRGAEKDAETARPVAAVQAPQHAAPQRDEGNDAPPAPPAPPGLLPFALAVARKDLLLTLVRGGALIQALLLGLLLVFVFSLSQDVGERLSPRSAAAVFWLSSMFCQVLFFNGLYALEERCSARIGLVLAPGPAAGVWLGKALAGLLLLMTAQLVLLPASMVFLGQDLAGDLPPAILGTVLLADAGMCVLGSLLGALSQGGGARESLLSVILFPLLTPLLLAGVSVGAAAFGSPSPDGPESWFGMAAAFDAVFAAAGLLLFAFMYTGDDS